MKIRIYHASAGFGHKKVAEVLGQGFLSRGLTSKEVTVEDALDFTSPFFHITYPGFYYNMVKYAPSVWGLGYEWLDHPAQDRWVRPIRRRWNRREGEGLLRVVKDENPDFIITTHFFSAELFATAKRRGELNAHLITVVTDFFPHAFWINEGTDDYWVMNETTRDAMLPWGVPAEKIHPGGIPVGPEFKPTGRKREILEKHGFRPDKLTLLITSGSFGLGPYGKILRGLEPFSDSIQCFLVCGNNKKMKAVLEKKQYPFPIKIFGFVDFMPLLMEASDFVIAKPGGATTVETLAKGVPMVVLHPIPGQESRNARFLKEHEAAYFLDRPDEIGALVKKLLEDKQARAHCKARIDQIARPHATDDLVSLVLEKADQRGVR